MKRFLTILALIMALTTAPAVPVHAASLPRLLPPIPSAPVQNEAAVPATATDVTLTIGDDTVTLRAYNIGGDNFFRLRDVAAVLNGTAARFNIAWHEAAGAITLLPGQAYISAGHMLARVTVTTTATVSNALVYIGAAPVDLISYNVGGANYFRLDQLGAVLGFDYNAADGSITILTQSNI